MKKIIILLFAVILIFYTFACSQNDADTPDAPILDNAESAAAEHEEFSIFNVASRRGFRRTEF